MTETDLPTVADVYVRKLKDLASNMLHERLTLESLLEVERANRAAIGRENERLNAAVTAARREAQNADLAIKYDQVSAERDMLREEVDRLLAREGELVDALNALERERAQVRETVETETVPGTAIKRARR